MKNVLKDLKSYLDKDYILIFPSSHSAKYYRDEIAREYKTAIDNTKLISVDEAKEKILQLPKNAKIVNSYMKRIFSINFVKENNELQTLYSEKTPENIKVKIVKEMIEESKRVLDSKLYDQDFYKKITKNEEQLKDLSIISNSYKKFLETNSLVDNFYIDKTYLEAKQKLTKHVLVFSNAVLDLNYIRMNSKDLIEYNIEIENKNKKLKEYANISLEIDNVVYDIQRKLDSNVKPEDIVISLANWSYLPYLEKECKIRNIKLSPIKGQALSSYKAYRMLKHFETLYNTDFLFSNLKSFILDDGVCFNDKDKYIDLLKEASLKYKEIGSKNPLKDDYLSNVNKLTSTNLELYKDLRSSIILLNEITNPSKLVESFNTLKTKILSSDSYFVNDKESNETRVFSFILKQMTSFVKSLEIIGCKKIDNLFSVFIDEIKNINYAKKSQEGILTLPYPLANTFFTKHHYILGLSSKNISQMYYRKFDTIDNNINDIKLTQNILNLALFSENTYLSYSPKTYEKDQIPPAYFMQNDIIDTPKDSNFNPTIFDQEYCLLTNKAKDITISKNHKKAIERFLSVYNQYLSDDKEYNNEFKHLEGLPEKEDGKYTISPTLLDKFLVDPYSYYFEYVLKLESFEINNRALNHIDIGTAIHSCYENFNEFIKDNSYVGDVVDNFSSWYENNKDKELEPAMLLQLGVYKVMNEGFKGEKFTIPLIPKYLSRFKYLTYEKLTKASFDSLYKYNSIDKKVNIKTIGCETAITVDDPYVKDLRLKGKIDYIYSELNNIKIVDFKTGKSTSIYINEKNITDNTHWQLFLYARMYEESTKNKLTSCAYYLLGDDGLNEYMDISSKEKIDALNTKLEELIKLFDNKSIENFEGKSAYNMITRRDYEDE